jgi:hypothetical protein
VYRQQVESGKAIVKSLLAKLATDLDQERINRFAFKVTGRDFDSNRVSIVDLDNVKVVAKLEENNLADAPAQCEVKVRLEAHVIAAVTQYCR